MLILVKLLFYYLCISSFQINLSDFTGACFKVVRKKLLEAERGLNVEKENVERLKKKIGNLEEELYAKNLELDTMNEKYTGVIESRDTQIRVLQVWIALISKVLLITAFFITRCGTMLLSFFKFI